MLENLTETVWEFTQSFPAPLQWAAVLIAGAIPLIDGHGAAIIGIAVGVHPVSTTVSAIIGNLISMLLCVSMSDYFKQKITRKTVSENKARKRERLHRLYNRYGVPTVSLIAQFWVPAALTAVLLISFGATKRQVITWQSISIIVWTVAVALVATGVIRIMI